MNLGKIITVCRSHVIENNAITILLKYLEKACYEHKMFLVKYVKKHISIFFQTDTLSTTFHMYELKIPNICLTHPTATLGGSQHIGCGLFIVNLYLFLLFLEMSIYLKLV